MFAFAIITTHDCDEEVRAILIHDIRQGLGMGRMFITDSPQCNREIAGIIFIALRGFNFVKPLFFLLPAEPLPFFRHREKSRFQAFNNGIGVNSFMHIGHISMYRINSRRLVPVIAPRTAKEFFVVIFFSCAHEIHLTAPLVIPVNSDTSSAILPTAV